MGFGSTSISTNHDANGTSTDRRKCKVFERRPVVEELGRQCAQQDSRRSWIGKHSSQRNAEKLHRTTPPQVVNLQSCYLLFTYNFKYLDPLEAHFLLFSLFRFSIFSSESIKILLALEKKKEETLVNIYLFIQIIRNFIQLMLILYVKALSVTISF